jgi:DNA-binding PadR family transcriptional regulator
MAPPVHRSPLALAVLCMLEAGPMHPYAIQQFIKEWGKDQVVNVGQRATLYKMITRLAGADLIQIHDTVRDQRYPERTTYALTDAGRATSRTWLSDMLATPRNEFPDFPAALSFLMMLTPTEARTLLTTRRDALASHLADLDAALATEVSPPPVWLLEVDHARAVTLAEHTWLTTVIARLDASTLTWTREQLAAAATQRRGSSVS